MTALLLLKVAHAGAFHLYKKQEGVVTMPTGYKMGNAIAARLQNVVNQIFLEDIPLLPTADVPVGQSVHYRLQSTQIGAIL